MKLKYFKSITLIFALFLSVQFFTTNSAITLNAGDQDYLAFAEEMPTVVGGMSTIVKVIKYPEIAIKTNVQGRVYILAYINEDGSCSEAKVIKGIGAGCDEAAVEAVKSATFTPGKNKGIPVKVKLSLPIEFKL
jgi:protein TonB